MAREAGAVEQEAAALGGLGDAEYVRGGMLIAHDAFRRCVELAHRRGLGRIEVANRPMMAFTQWLVGDTRGALGEALAAIAAATRVGHLRAQMIAHHAAYLCRHSLTEWPEAWGHAEAALALARQLDARRLEAEALAFGAELHWIAGRRSDALADIGQALSISRETGMAFLGPMILGALAVATDDEAVRNAALAEADELLAAGSVSQNHFLFRRNAIEACLRVRAWDHAERHAAALEDYARREPSAWTGFVVARGRALAAHGRRRQWRPDARGRVAPAEGGRRAPRAPRRTAGDRGRAEHRPGTGRQPAVVGNPGLCHREPGRRAKALEVGLLQGDLDRCLLNGDRHPIKCWWAKSNTWYPRTEGHTLLAWFVTEVG